MPKMNRVAGSGLALALMGLTAGGLALWLLRRQSSNDSAADTEPRAAWAEVSWGDDALDLPRDSSAFEPAPVSDRQVSAQPHEQTPGPHWADDYEVLGPDELGAAYLARATETSSSRTEGDLALSDELPGFQISTPERPESDPEGDDDALAEIFGRSSRG